MDVLVYHAELQQSAFPDCCIQCGSGNTALTPVVLSDTFVSEYTRAVLPFCPAHQKAPVLSSGYPGFREFTSQGIIVTNASVEFAEALEAFRRTHPPDLSVTAPLPQDAPATPEAEQAYRRFALGALIVAVLAGIVIAGIVMLVRPGNSQPAVDPPNEHTLTNPHLLEE